LTGKPARQHVQKGLEAYRIRCRHDQIELGGDLGPSANPCPAGSYPVFKSILRRNESRICWGA
jgi:hypothetical protein